MTPRIEYFRDITTLDTTGTANMDTGHITFTIEMMDTFDRDPGFDQQRVSRRAQSLVEIDPTAINLRSLYDLWKKL